MLRVKLKAPITVRAKGSRIEAEIYLCHVEQINSRTLNAIVRMASALVKAEEKRLARGEAQ
jgi:hypothetical protein